MVTYEVSQGKVILDSIRIDGKKPMKSYLNALNKAQESKLWVLASPDGGSGWCFSGEVKLNQLEASIYNVTLRWYSLYERAMSTMNFKSLPFPVSTYDNLRYFLSAIDKKNYDLIN